MHVHSGCTAPPAACCQAARVLPAVAAVVNPGQPCSPQVEASEDDPAGAPQAVQQEQAAEPQQQREQQQQQQAAQGAGAGSQEDQFQQFQQQQKDQRQQQHAQGGRHGGRGGRGGGKGGGRGGGRGTDGDGKWVKPQSQTQRIAAEVQAQKVGVPHCLVPICSPACCLCCLAIWQALSEVWLLAHTFHTFRCTASRPRSPPALLSPPSAQPSSWPACPLPLPPRMLCLLQEAEKREREERQRAFEERQTKLAAEAKQRAAKSKQFRKKTAHGQPVMKYRVEKMLEQLQQ